VIFIAIFIYLYLEKLSAQNLIISGTIFTIIGYIFWDKSISKTDPSYEYKRKSISSIIFFFLFKKERDIYIKYFFLLIKLRMENSKRGCTFLRNIIMFITNFKNSNNRYK